jgi:hypothetical protein
MKKFSLLIVSALCCNMAVAQNSETQKNLNAYIYSVDNKTFCHVVNGTPGAEAAFYSERWGGKQVKSAVLNVNGEMEFSEKNFSAAFVLNRGTGKIFYMDAPEFSISELKANFKDGIKIINWKGSADVNKDIVFEVLSSNDGIIYEPLTSIPATKIQTEQGYSANDNSEEELFYQIKVINKKEGTRYVSPTLALNHQSVSVYPTLVKDEVNINLSLVKSKSEYAIINNAGQTVKSGRLGTGKNTFNISELASGSYVINVTGSGKSIASEKIVKQ